MSHFAPPYHPPPPLAPALAFMPPAAAPGPGMPYAHPCDPTRMRVSLSSHSAPPPPPAARMAHPGQGVNDFWEGVTPPAPYAVRSSPLPHTPPPPQHQYSHQHQHQHQANSFNPYVHPQTHHYPPPPPVFHHMQSYSSQQPPPPPHSHAPPGTAMRRDTSQHQVQHRPDPQGWYPGGATYGPAPGHEAYPPPPSDYYDMGPSPLQYNVYGPQQPRRTVEIRSAAEHGPSRPSPLVGIAPAPPRLSRSESADLAMHAISGRLANARTPPTTPPQLDSAQDFPPLSAGPSRPAPQVKGKVSKGKKKVAGRDEATGSGASSDTASPSAVAAQELPEIGVMSISETSRVDAALSASVSSLGLQETRASSVTTPSVGDAESSAGGSGAARAKMDTSLARPMDRFATTFVPAWLRDLPPSAGVDRLAPLPPFPSPTYGLDQFPSAQAVGRPTSLSSGAALLSLPPPSPNEHIRPLDSTKALSESEYYESHFTSLLAVHLRDQVEEARAATIRTTALRLDGVASRSAAPSSGPGPAAPLGSTFRVYIPGVREDSPRLAIGDKLTLRGLYPELQTGSRHAVEAEVVGLVKAQGLVFIRSPFLQRLDESLPRNANGDAEYQIQFAVSAAPVCTMQESVSVLGAALGKQEVARRWLFPDGQDLEGLRKGRGELNWEDVSLNHEQKAAVRAIALDEHRIPFLISGPPGTGKTKTLVETALQIIRTDPLAHVLICAPSNPAADTVARRLSRHLGPDAMLRLNASSRTFAEVPDALLPFCCVVEDKFDLPPFAQLMRYRVVVCGLQDAGVLRAAHASNAALESGLRGMREVFYPNADKAGEEGVDVHWTHLLVDEASEPEVAIALSVVLPFDAPGEAVSVMEIRRRRRSEPVIVLCGDVHQLGPIIPSQQAREGELDVSLLQRLFEREVYAQHPALRGRNRGGAGTSIAGGPALPFAHLFQNYRSYPSILMVPSAMFYNDALVPSARDVSLMSWSRLPNPRIPILFWGSETEESCIDEGASWFNSGEIEAVLELIVSLRSENPHIQPKEIAVITPWREQVWRMRARLRAEGLGGVDVGNVETYQGGEFRVTILSCVRSRTRFLEEDKRTNMGLYNEPRRFNVAITRAKELLVVVGNANLLKTDPYWNGFLQIMLRNGLYRGPELDIEMSGAYISRIESAHHRTASHGVARGKRALNSSPRSSGSDGHEHEHGIYERHEQSANDDDDDSHDDEAEAEEHGLFLAGEMARETLREDWDT